jgi:hypothetical protein
MPNHRIIVQKYGGVCRWLRRELVIDVQLAAAVAMKARRRPPKWFSSEVSPKDAVNRSNQTPAWGLARCLLAF